MTQATLRHSPPLATLGAELRAAAANKGVIALPA